MAKMIFVNLPVRDVARSTAFYQSIGATRDERFSNDHASAMQMSDTIAFMLLDHAFYAGFTPKPIADAHATSQALFCLSEESRADVDARVAKAGAAGGRMDPGPTQDHGFMYGRSYEDPDGHHFEVMYMDVEAAMAAMQPQAA